MQWLAGSYSCSLGAVTTSAFLQVSLVDLLVPERAPSTPLPPFVTEIVTGQSLLLLSPIIVARIHTAHTHGTNTAHTRHTRQPRLTHYTHTVHTPTRDRSCVPSGVVYPAPNLAGILRNIYNQEPDTFSGLAGMVALAPLAVGSDAVWQSSTGNRNIFAHTVAQAASSVHLSTAYVCGIRGYRCSSSTLQQLVTAVPV